MTTTCDQIGDIVLRVESPFLDTPGLTLTADQAQRCFDVDARTCQAVLDVLTEARVLTRNPEGVYARYFPRTHAGLAACTPTSLQRSPVSSQARLRGPGR